MKRDSTKILAAAVAGAMSMPEVASIAAAANAIGPHYGRRAIVGQYTAPGTDRNGNACVLDRAERVNFDRSKYIPGNGAAHRLGRTRG